MVDRGDRIAGRECQKPIALRVKERIVFNDEPADSLPGQRCKVRFELRCGARLEYEPRSSGSPGAAEALNNAEQAGLCILKLKC